MLARRERPTSLDGSARYGRAHVRDENVDEQCSDGTGLAGERTTAADPRPNASLQAIAQACPPAPGWVAKTVVPFSSARKWSGADFGETGTWVLGAPDVLLPDGAAERAKPSGSARRGCGCCCSAGPGAPGEVTPVALTVLEQKIRGDARETLGYVAAQGVAVKVISGDNAASVGAVARVLALPGAEAPVDARKLAEDPGALAAEVETGTVFGRVSPAQKRAMVAALQSRGHTVAMTGDGVNDVLALKDADVGVAMGAGSPATRSVAQIVLLDNAFATLPQFVGEGRRVIGWFTIGLSAFVLSLAPNNDRARGGFVGRVLRMAVPAGVAIAVACFVAYVLVHPGCDTSQAALITLMVLAVWVLGVIARPHTWWKAGPVSVMVLISGLFFVLPVTQRLAARAWPGDVRFDLRNLSPRERRRAASRGCCARLRCRTRTSAVRSRRSRRAGLGGLRRP